MNTSEFDYDLPPGLIAQTPLPDRAASRLMHVSLQSGQIAHRTFRDITSLLMPGDLLVYNDTRVTARRLLGRKTSGAAAELLLLRQVGPNLFQCLAKPGRRLQNGAVVEFPEGLVAQVESVQEEFRMVSFLAPSNWQQVLDRVGLVPLPPYITTSLSDSERYQTVFADTPGSAAAPTAGLHFTQDLLESLRQTGVQTARVTLEVSLDTFRPMSVQDTGDHVMHGERCRVSPETAEAVNSAKGRVIGVGTTSVRTLESFATAPRRIGSGEKVTTVFIQPGHRFQAIDGMFTNFHMPRTTMMLMISALAGTQTIKTAYDSAVKEGYRFLSFGDSMLLL